MARRLWTLGIVTLLAACGGGDDGSDATVATTATPSTTTAPASSESTTTVAATTTTEGASEESSSEGGSTTSVEETTTSTTTTSEPQPEVRRTDWLTFAQGALFVEQTGLATGSAGGVLRMIDGDDLELTVSNDGREPVSVLFKLPALTTFDRLAVPNVVETPGNVTFYRDVTVAGSATGSDAGFETLASFVLETHGPDESVTEITPPPIPVRWVRVDLANGINIEEGDEGRTNLQFSEIIGNGTQEPRSLTDAFTGVWDYRLTERTDIKGKPLELVQSGATVTGCWDTMSLTGTVNGAIARLTGVDPATDDIGAFVMVADDDGSISTAVSLNNGIFNAYTPVVDPEVTSSPCSAAPPPTTCPITVYVNFDFDSATIRPESEQVIVDLYTNLTAEGGPAIGIVGHTSTEGSEAYNLDLSTRRAVAIADALVEQGYDEDAISATGAGESMPLLSPDDDETSRELNRRVVVECV